MTRLEYDLVRAERPDLKFPDWWRLMDHSKEKVKNLSHDQLIAARTANLLSRDYVSHIMDMLQFPYER